MGCDIHAWLEVKTDDKWQIVPVCPCAYCDGEGRRTVTRTHNKDGSERKVHKVETEECFGCHGSGKTELHEEEDDRGTDEKPEIYKYITGGNCYRGRNYFLFAVIAGVRNYYDIPESELWERGIPEDASPEYAAYCEQGDGDLHSHNWLLLDEAIKLCIEHDKSLGEEGFPLREFVRHVIERQMKPLAEKHGDQGVRMVFCFDN